MSALCLAVLFSFVLAQEEGAVAEQPEARGDFLAAASQFAAAESYAFERTIESSGGRRGAPENPPPVLAGRYQTDQPLELSQGDVLAYLKGETLVYRTGEGDWQVLDAAAGRDNNRERGRRAGGEGPGAGQGEPGARGGAGQGEPGAGSGAGQGAEGQPEPPRGEGRRARFGGPERGLFMLLRTKPPHLLVQDVEEAIGEVTREEADGTVTLKAVLTPEGAAALVPQGGFGGRRRGGAGEAEGEQAARPDAKGSLSLVLTEQGVVHSVVLETSISMGFGERSFERSQKQVFTISELNEVEIELPAEVLEHFDS